MKLVLINEFEAVDMLKKDWNKPVNSDTATVKGQIHKTFYVPDSWTKGRKGVTVSRKGFKGRKSYKAYPNDIQDLLARMGEVFGPSFVRGVKTTEDREARTQQQTEYRQLPGSNKRERA